MLVIDPVGFLEMSWLLAKCSLVLTDSGGVQKEAYFHKKPCITLRDETEWVELVDAGCNRLMSPFLPDFIDVVTRMSQTKILDSSHIYLSLIHI